LVDADRCQIRTQILKGRKRPAMLIRPEPIQSPGSR
jgi:hypothetical protein